MSNKAIVKLRQQKLNAEELLDRFASSYAENDNFVHKVQLTDEDIMLSMMGLAMFIGQCENAMDPEKTEVAINTAAAAVEALQS